MTDCIALIRKDDDSDYSVHFPDLPVCLTAGTTLNQAIRNAGEALAFHLEGLASEGLKIPGPSDLDSIMADPDNAGAVVALVKAPSVQSRAVPVTITMDENLLRNIDNAAGTARQKAKYQSSGSCSDQPKFGVAVEMR